MGVAPPVSTPKITPNHTGVQNKETPSLFRRKTKEEKPKEEIAEKPQEELLSEDFTEESLQETWEAFQKIRLAQGAGDMEKLVLGRSINKKDDLTVVITLYSSLEKTILDKFEAILTNFLRAQLKNSSIRVSHEIREMEQSQKLYTSQDKFEYMASINPAIKELKERLGLDFEF